MKNNKVHKESHVSPTKYGSGDSYGSGIKQKVGTIQRDYLTMTSPKKSNKPPKSLA